jgi:BCCT family betaine/carnitine transporter
VTDTTVDNPADTNYEVGQDNVQVAGLDIHNPVFFISSLVIIAFIAYTLTFQEQAGALLGALRPWLTDNFDWVFMLAGNLFVLVCIALILTPYGSIRIGGRNAEPEFSYAGWFAMLFAAGMGIGLMFYGVAEPLYHTQSPPLGIDGENTALAREAAMAATVFHWGLHPWAIYGTLALGLAFFCYNRGLPLTLRSLFFPLLGDRVWGWFGHVIDTMAVFATLFGLATSLGYGAQQASAGLSYLFGLPSTDTAQVVLIACVTGAALVSVVAGLDAGVKRLSELNMSLAFLLLLFIIAVGPTLAILSGFFTNIWAYFQYLPSLSNWVGREDTDFMHGWTTFYWAWWISWSPFVGTFIARVSKGRTIREFMLGVLIVPTLVSVLWMTAFGGTAVDLYLEQGVDALAQGLDLSLFVMAEQLPLTAIVSFIGIVLVLVFFVTSSDSGSLVIDTITAGGKLEAPVTQRIFWATAEGVVAIALLLGGGLGALQSAAIATGFPFAIILMAACVGLFAGLHQEYRVLVRASAAAAE